MSNIILIFTMAAVLICVAILAGIDAVLTWRGPIQFRRRTVKAKRFCKQARTPTRAHPCDAGLDLYACIPSGDGKVTVRPGEAVMIPTGCPRASSAASLPAAALPRATACAPPTAWPCATRATEGSTSSPSTTTAPRSAPSPTATALPSSSFCPISPSPLRRSPLCRPPSGERAALGAAENENRTGHRQKTSDRQGLLRIYERRRDCGPPNAQGSQLSLRLPSGRAGVCGQGQARQMD